MDVRLKLFWRAILVVLKLGLAYALMVSGDYFVYQGF